MIWHRKSSLSEGHIIPKTPWLLINLINRRRPDGKPGNVSTLKRRGNLAKEVKRSVRGAGRLSPMGAQGINYSISWNLPARSPASLRPPSRPSGSFFKYRWWTQSWRSRRRPERRCQRDRPSLRKCHCPNRDLRLNQHLFTQHINGTSRLRRQDRRNTEIIRRDRETRRVPSAENESAGGRSTI